MKFLVMKAFFYLAIIALFVALKVGQGIIWLLFGVISLALLGGAGWWFFVRP